MRAIDFLMILSEADWFPDDAEHFDRCIQMVLTTCHDPAVAWCDTCEEENDQDDMFSHESGSDKYIEQQENRAEEKNKSKRSTSRMKGMRL